MRVAAPGPLVQMARWSINWGIEDGSPNSLLRHGFTKNSLPPGTQIVVDGYEAKSGSKRAMGSSFTMGIRSHPERGG